MNLADYIPPKFIELFSDPDFSKAIKGYCTYLIKEDKEYREEIQTYFNECLITSELKPVLRLAELETVTGLNDYSDFEEEEHEPTIPEQISLLSEKLEALSEPSRPHIEGTASNIGITPETTLDLKACAIVEHLKEAVKPNEFGEYMITKKILNEFMTEKISLELRVKEVTRQTKKEIFKRAIKLFPDIVCIKISKSGNKTEYLTLKSSLKRTDTVACTRLTGLGIWA